MSYKIHPAAELFPQMSDEDFDALVADIKENGLRDPIVIWADDRLIDGRHRLKACKKLGIEPEVRQIGGDVDPYKFVVSTNLHRRHLTESQRSMVAGKRAKLQHGSNQHSGKSGEEGSIDLSTIEQAAELLKVSPKSVKRAREVLEHGSKDLITAVEKGDVEGFNQSRTVQQGGIMELRPMTEAAISVLIGLFVATVLLLPILEMLARQNERGK